MSCFSVRCIAFLLYRAFKTLHSLAVKKTLCRAARAVTRQPVCGWPENHRHASNRRTKAEFTLALFLALIGELCPPNLFTPLAAPPLSVPTSPRFCPFLTF